MRLKENRIILKKSMWSIMFDTLLPENLFFQLIQGRRNNKRFYICSEVIDSITDANSGRLGRGLEVVLGVVWGVSTDPDRSYHFTKIFPFEVNFPFI